MSLVLMAGVFALLVQSAFFFTSDWMLGDLGYHRGVAYTMQAGQLQGEGPYRDLISYYGGLLPLGVGAAAAWTGWTFDAVLSVVSWPAGLLWVGALAFLGRRLWPKDPLLAGAFVVLGTIAVPFSRDRLDVWVESTLASSQNFWPLYPRDVALGLLLVLAAGLLSGSSRVRMIVGGLVIGIMVAFHMQLAMLAGALMAVSTVARWLLDRDWKVTGEVLGAAAIALVTSAWWWVPRVAALTQSGQLMLADYPGRLPLRLDLPGFVTAMGVVGALSLIGFPLMLSRRHRSGRTDMLVSWAGLLLGLVMLDRALGGMDLISERRLWLVFSIPATAAAAIALVAIARSVPRPAFVVFLIVAILLPSIPGLQGTVSQIRSAWTEGQASGRYYDPAVWRPLWDQLNREARDAGGIIVGTYDSYATWTWSFSGAQVVSLWLPGPFKLGFDPEPLTGSGYLDRLGTLTSMFSGPEALCRTASAERMAALLLDRREGMLATYDVTPAMAYRVAPERRDVESIDREVEPGIVYRDLNGYDILILKAGAEYRLGWSDSGIRSLVIEADLVGHEAPAMEVVVSGETHRFSGGEPGRSTIVIGTPTGVDGVLIRSLEGLRLFRISAYTTSPATSGRDGPAIIRPEELCLSSN